MATSRRLSRRVGDVVVHVLDVVVPPTAQVVLHSSPDLDDSIVALLRAAPETVTCIVLAEDPAAARRRARALGLAGTHIVPRRGARGLWRYLRAHVTMTTHGMFGSRPRGGTKHVVGLWHGEFGKLIGAFTGEPARHFDWVPVSSELSRSLRSAEFELDRALIHVVGSPRHALLDDTGHCDRWGGRRVVAWAPTYRTSSTGQIRADGDPRRLATEVALDDPELLELLRRHDATVWYRPHPVSGVDPGGASEPWVRGAADTDLERLGATFYELLGDASVLVTDYSSLWVDFLRCEQPMVAFCPDLEDYRRTRGLALEPHERWFPGPVTTSRREFLDALDLALSDPSAGADDRERMRGLLQTAPDGAVTRVWAHVASVLSS